MWKKEKDNKREKSGKVYEKKKYINNNEIETTTIKMHTKSVGVVKIKKDSHISSRKTRRQASRRGKFARGDAT